MAQRVPLVILDLVEELRGIVLVLGIDGELRRHIEHRFEQRARRRLCRSGRVNKLTAVS
ncbi:MAG: hypothetical protein ACXWWP_02985 [Candidatus Binatia bacterium]